MTSDTIVSAGPRANRVPFIALMSANAISLIGNQLTALAIPWFVLVTTGSAAKTGIVGFCTLLPAVLAGFFGGALVDRVGHKRMSILADVLSGVTLALVPLLYHRVGLAFAALLALVFFGALFDAPGGTARAALVPDLSKLAGLHLEGANATQQLIQGTSSLLGPPLAGILIATLGASNVLWVDAATFAVSAALVAIAVPASAAGSMARGRGRYRDDVMDGWRFVRRTRLLLATVLVAVVLNFLLSPLFGVVLPVVARQVYGGAKDLGIVAAGVGAGTLAGSALYGVFGTRLPRRPVLIGACLLLGAPLWAMATLPSLLLATGAMVVFGIASGVVNPLVGTALQEQVPAALRGRVMGTTTAACMAAAPLGMLLAGSVTEALGARGILLMMALGTSIGCTSVLFIPAFHDLDSPVGGRQ